MPLNPRISEAEWLVMGAFWDDGAKSAQDVICALGDEPGWHMRTVKTLIGRLVKKGLLTFERDGNRYLYQPCVSKDDCVLAESKSFLKRVFNGSLSPLVSQLVENNVLSQEEIAELKRILETKA